MHLRQKICKLYNTGALHITIGTFATKFVAFFGSIVVVRLLSKQDYGLMSYVENFCKDIAIIDNGNIVLSGNLIEIKKKFGEKQLVLSPIDGNLEQLEQIIRTRLSDFIVPTGRTKEDIIIKCVKDISRKELLAQILECDIEIEHFETYKPSLNDIFVATVGDEENNIKQTKMTGGTV